MAISELSELLFYCATCKYTEIVEKILASDLLPAFQATMALSLLCDIGDTKAVEYFLECDHPAELSIVAYTHNSGGTFLSGFCRDMVRKKLYGDQST